MAGSKSTKERFDELLKQMSDAQNVVILAGREASNMALAHFVEHGDVEYLNRFHDALHKNLLRRTAFIKWAANHAPLVFKQGKFSKDKSETARKPDLAGATGVPFWEFAPEAQLVYFKATEFVAALENTIKRFEDQSKRLPEDRDAADLVKRAHNMIAQLRPATNVPDLAIKGEEAAAAAAA